MKELDKYIINDILFIDRLKIFNLLKNLFEISYFAHIDIDLVNLTNKLYTTISLRSY